MNCPHCKKEVLLKTFQEHKSLFYNEKHGTWIVAQHGNVNVGMSSKSTHTNTLVSFTSSDDSDQDPLLSSKRIPLDEVDTEIMDMSGTTRSNLSDSNELSSSSSSDKDGDKDDKPPSSCDPSSADEDCDESNDSDADHERNFVTVPVAAKATPFVKWIVALVLAFQAAYVLPYAATNWIFEFLHLLFKTLALINPTPFICAIAALLPGSLYLGWKLMKLKYNNFETYVVCRKCNSVYTFQQCLAKNGSKMLSQRCTFRTPTRKQELTRGTLLLKTVKFRDRGKEKLVPWKVYPYKSVIKSMEELLNTPGIQEKCEKWRKRVTPCGLYTDVYDGRIWAEFQNYDKRPFLSMPNAYAYMLNIDWFQPYKDTQYSVGAIYLALMNLPRDERFKTENLIIVGLIPGPHEPSLSINSFLEPLVSELKKLWVGVKVKIKGTEQTIKGALLLIGCDIPASKKVCGFKAFGSKRGCSRCFLKFKGKGFIRSYADFDRDNWPKRTDKTHRQQVKKCSNADVKEKEKLEKEYGCRYTVLLDLPYYDSIRMSSIVDPLHNMYLGSAKHVLKKIWIEREIITKRNFDLIQKRVDDTTVEYSVGRIPSKISSNFGGFTGNQWMTWTNLFSLIALRGIITGEDYECWKHFVLASRLLSSCISKEQLVLADGLLLQFCRRVSRMYGNEKATPNMHLHGHIRECVEDYGPVQGFWLFSFERFNGMLARQPNNKKSIEVQLMRRFTRNLALMHQDLPSEYRLTFEPVYPLTNASIDSADSKRPTSVLHSLSHYFQMTSVNLHHQATDWKIDLTYFHLPSTSHRAILTPGQVQYLSTVYNFLYPSLEYSVNSTICKYDQIHSPSGTVLGSYRKRSHCSCFVMANWGKDGNIKIDSLGTMTAGRVLFYFIHSIIQNSEPIQHLFAYVEWYQPHPEFSSLGKPLQVYHSNLFQSEGPASFIPIQRIANKFVFLIENDKMICCSYVPKYYF